MKFSCDSCHAQYVISDDKVGANGVIVRCKKCSQKIIVKKAAPPPAAFDDDDASPTVVLQNPLAKLEAMNAAAAASAAASLSASPDGAVSTTVENPLPPPAPVPSFGGSGIDDELGKAFDSVLNEPTSPGGPAPALDSSSAPTEHVPVENGGGGGFDDEEDETDRQSTRVVDLASIASLTKNPEGAAEKKPAAKPEPDASQSSHGEFEPAKKNGTAAAADAPSAAVEWFVAINESQTGPLSIEGVRGHWDKGELSADSLVWRSGMPDWKPLSTVPELANVLVPVPKQPEVKAEAPAGAVATGVQAPAASPIPPQQDAAEPEWKPSAASALESLVKEELQALDKPAPKPEPTPAPAPSQSRGLMDDLPEPSSPGLPLPPEPLAAPVSPKRAEDSVSEQLPRRSERRERHEREDLERSDVYVPRHEREQPKSRSGMWLGIGIAGGGIGIAAVAALLVFLIMKPGTTVPGNAAPAQPSVAVAPAQPVQPAQQPAAQPAAQPAQQPAAEAPKPAEVAKPVEPAKPVEVAKPAEPKQVEPPKVAEPVRRQPPAERAPHEPIARREPTVRENPRPPPEPPPEPPRKTGNKVDDDFNKLFGGSGGGDSAPAETPKQPKKSNSVYIPPPPGGGGGKETLGPGDIMEVVRGNIGSIRKCTDDEKGRNGGATGEIKMRWIIRQNGTVTGIKTMTPDFEKTPLSACLTAVIKNLKFPAYTGSQMEPVDFPFKF